MMKEVKSENLLFERFLSELKRASWKILVIKKADTHSSLTANHVKLKKK